MLDVLELTFSCFTVVGAAGFDSEYCEINSLRFSSCCSFSAVVIGVFGDARNELEPFSRVVCLVACARFVRTGGVAELARPSRLFSNSAFSSTALALIWV